MGMRQQLGQQRGAQQEGTRSFSRAGAAGTWEPPFPVSPSPLTFWAGTWKTGGAFNPIAPKTVPLTISPQRHPSPGWLPPALPSLG